VPKEKVTLTVDTGQLEELRRLVGARSMSSTVELALADYLAKQRHLAAVDEWLAEMERDDGPIPQEYLDWADEVFAARQEHREIPRPPHARRSRGTGKAS
jgi:predicted transcriptional regulator